MTGREAATKSAVSPHFAVPFTSYAGEISTIGRVVQKTTPSDAMQVIHLLRMALQRLAQCGGDGGADFVTGHGG